MEEIIKKINQLKRRLYVIYIILLTVYIATVNSYALFSLYPALKQQSHGAHFVTIAIYLLLISPLIIIAYVKRKSTNLRIIIGGLGALAIATGIRYMIEPTPLLQLVHHGVLYLITGFAEEYLWRGVLWKSVSKKTNSLLLTLLIVTVHFTLLHIPYAILRTDMAIVFLLQVFVLGMVLGTVRHYAKNIRIPAFFHAITNMISYT